MLNSLHLLKDMSINKRVEQLIDKVADTKSAFSATTGISTVILSHISSGRNKVSLSAVEQILIAYPTVSAEWLILGKGKMYKEEKDHSQIELLLSRLNSIRNEIRQNFESVDSKIETLDKLIDSIEL